MFKRIILLFKKWWPQIVACLLIAASVLSFMIYAHCFKVDHHFGGPGISWACASPFFLGLGILYLFRHKKG
jgi:hypothetical protein